MLNIVHEYAKKWCYQLNEAKSVMMVFGEAAGRRRECVSRRWMLGDAEISEADETHHLGILHSVSPSPVDRTNNRASTAKSAFLALNAVDSCFGCLHLLTSLKQTFFHRDVIGGQKCVLIRGPPYLYMVIVINKRAVC